MSVAALELPYIQPLRFVPQAGEILQDARNNLSNPDLVWFTESIRDWQAKTDYVQKWQFNDRVGVYVNAATSKGCTVAIIDSHGKIWHTFTVGNVALVPTNTIPVGNTSLAAYAYYTNFRFATISGMPEGIYWAYLTVAYDLNNDGTPDYWRHNISEPMSIATVHPGTTHLDYYHSTNKPDEDILFSILNVRFSLRVKAEIVDFDTDSNDTQNEDSAEDVQMLASQAYRTMKYALTERVPSWLTDKIKRAWGCDTTSVDNVGYTKAIGAKWDTNRSPKVPKIIASLPLREPDKRQGIRQITTTAFPVYVQSNGFPYMVRSIYLADISNSSTYLTGAIIHDTTEEGAFVTALNAEIAADRYAGVFSLVRATGVATLTWTNAGGDLFIYGGADILDKPLAVQYLTTNICQPISFINPNVTVDYGDGTSENVSGAGGFASTAHTYGSSGTQDIFIFGDYNAIRFNDGYLSAPSGFIPRTLGFFTIHDSFTITTFDCSLFGSQRLQTLALFNCSALTTIANFSAMDFNILTTIDLHQCALNTAVASGIVVDTSFAVNNNGQPGYGSLYIQNQGPAAPMNVAGANAVNDLITNWGWDVQTD